MIRSSALGSRFMSFGQPSSRQSADPEYEPAQIARAVITTGLFWGDEDTEDKAAVAFAKSLGNGTVVRRRHRGPVGNHRSASGGNLVIYVDSGTRRSWVCGESPVDVPDRAVLEWVVERCRYGDAIIEHGIAFVLVQPVIEPTGA